MSNEKLELNKSYNMFIIKIISTRPDFNGCVIKCRDTKTGHTFKFKGSKLNINVDKLKEQKAVILIPKNVETHPRFGDTYIIDFIDEPMNKKKSINVLKNIKSIGDKKADTIYETLKPFVIEDLIESSDAIDKVQTLTKNNQKYVKKWFDLNRNTLSEKRRFMNFGFTHIQYSFIKAKLNNISFEDYIKKPYQILDVIEENKFINKRDIPNFTFKHIDKCVVDNNVDIDPKTRASYAIDYAFKYYLPRSGDTLFNKYEAAKKIISDVLSIDNLDVDLVVPLIENHKKLSCVLLEDEISPFDDESETFYIHDDIRFEENYVYSYLSGNKSYDIDDRDIVTEYELTDGSHIKLDLNQERAVKKSISNQYSIINGGPGTGKTTTLYGLIKTIHSKYESKQLKMNKNVMIYGYAPTAKATKRMKETIGSLGIQCNTIASLIVSEGFKIEPKSIVIVDESSMIDTQTMYGFLSKIPDSCQIVFVGDENQLPPIGYGEIFKNLISSKFIPTHTLDVVHRQNEDSNIINICNSIKNKETINYKNDVDITMIDTKDAGEKTIEFLNNIRKDKNTPLNLNEITILTPYSNPDITMSTKYLNNHVHHMFNNNITIAKRHKKVSVGSGKHERTFVEGDIVINTENFYIDDDFDNDNVRIANGDIGVVTNVICDLKNSNKYKIEVEFEDISYVFTHIDSYKLEHAYAITVHKSQGSEFPYVIVTLPDFTRNNDQFLVRNLIYTAVSRAKKHLIVIGPKDSFQQMVNNKLADRFTYFGHLCKLI